MKLTKELIEKAKTAKSAEELLEMAKAENIELSKEEASKVYAELHKTGELSDEELDNVAGGCGSDDQNGDSAQFSVGQRVQYTEVVNVPNQGCKYYHYYGNVTEILPKQDGVFQIKVKLDNGTIAICPENKLSRCWGIIF